MKVKGEWCMYVYIYKHVLHMYVYTYIRVYAHVVHGVLKPTKANTWLNYVEFSKPCQAGQLHAQWPHRPHGARGAGAWQSTHGPWAHEPRAPWASLRRSLQPLGVKKSDFQSRFRPKNGEGEEFLKIFEIWRPKIFIIIVIIDDFDDDYGSG